MTTALFLLLVKGAAITLQVSLLAMALAMVAGIILGAAGTSRLVFLRAIVLAYVDVIRAIPLLIIIFFVYYGLPVALRIDMPGYLAATISLTVYGSAYTTEAVRSGILSVSKDQWSAATALALRYASTMTYVVAPQAARVVLPVVIGIFNDLIKGSAVVSMIGFIELTQTAINIRGSIYSIEPLLWAGVLYFLMCLTVSALSTLLQRSIAQGGL